MSEQWANVNVEWGQGQYLEPFWNDIMVYLEWVIGNCHEFDQVRDSLDASRAELSTGRMDPRVGSGHDFAGFWRVGSALRIY